MELNDKQIHIIEIAERMFAEQGYDGTSIRDISKESGVNIAMVSYYFGSKEKLMEAIFHYRISHSWFTVKEPILNSDLGPLEKIYALLDSFLDKLEEKAYFHSIVIRQQLLGDRSPVIHLLDEARKTNYELLKKVISEGQDCGIFRKDADVALFILTMVGVGYQFMHSRNFYRSVSGLDHQKDPSFNDELKGILREHLHQIFKTLLINP